MSLDAAPVKEYIQECAQKILEEAVYNVGLQGGYIEPAGNKTYGEPGTVEYGLNGFLVDDAGYNVPYYLDESIESRPNLEDTEEKMERYLIVEFESCFDVENFKAQGYDIEIPYYDYESMEFDFSRLPVNSDVEFTNSEVIAHIKYPIKIFLGTRSTGISDFIARVPIRLPYIYAIADRIINELRQNELKYTINQDCASFDEEHLTNIYFKDGIVQIVDYKPYHSYLHQSYFFQFALRNTKFRGQCIG
jgi:hypothetical protein